MKKRETNGLDGDTDSDEGEYVSHKDEISILHIGQPSPTKAQFASVIKKPNWPNNIWSSGQLIYSIRNPSKCLKPPQSTSDTTLRFDSRFESGNLSTATLIAPDTYHAVIEYDHNNSGSCQWFYFQITNVRKDIKYMFYISGFHKNNGVFTSGSKVFYYSEKNAQRNHISWQRCGSYYAYGVTMHKKNGKRSTLQFQMQFPYDYDTCYLCYAIPYTYTDLRRNISKWEHCAPGLITHDILCQTTGGRDCPILTITSPISSVPEDQRSCIFLTGRVHPGESNGSVVLHGVIDFLISPHPAARYLVDHCIIKIVPMINIDGVVEGFYRAGYGGVDLNRVWSDPDPIKHPVVYHTKNLFSSIAAERKVEAYIDFHGHSRLHGIFAYGCPNTENLDLKDKEKAFPRMLSFLSESFTWGRCTFSYPSARKDASRIVCRKKMGIVQSFTIESSFGGITSGPLNGYLYDEKLWKDFGGKVGEAVYHLVSADSPLHQYVEKELSNGIPQSNPTKVAKKELTLLNPKPIRSIKKDQEKGRVSMKQPPKNPGLIKLHRNQPIYRSNNQMMSSRSFKW